MHRINPHKKPLTTELLSPALDRVVVESEKVCYSYFTEVNKRQ
jgi:hypothetical protein